MKPLAMAVILFVSQAPPQPAKAIIEGTVFRGGTTEGIEGARVVVTKVAATPLTPAISPVSTDGQGRFQIKDLDAGSYRLTVAANGFARQDYGTKLPSVQGSPINVAAGQTLRDIVVRLLPTGNVTGRINDENARPAVGVQVQLMRASYNANGQRTFQSAGQTRTNDRGEYRLFWVTPGRYYLNAGPGRRSSRTEIVRSWRQPKWFSGELFINVLSRCTRCQCCEHDRSATGNRTERNRSQGNAATALQDSRKSD